MLLKRGKALVSTIYKWGRRIFTIRLAGILILSAALVALFSIFLPNAVDWHNVYRPAALALIRGHSPYGVPEFFNNPWILIPMTPLLLLPESVGRGILALCTLVSLAYLSHKFGARLLATAFFLISPPVIKLILDGNIDWLVIIGVILPPQSGLFLVTAKPQIGMAVVFFWLVQAWRKNGLCEVIKVFAPISAAYALSIILYGLWPLKFIGLPKEYGNASLWPMSIPVGLALAVASIRRQKIEFAMAASPCLSPYVLLNSWIGPLLAVASSVPETVAAVVGLWILFGMRLLGL